MAELIDIYDANLQYLGVMERVQAHQEGQWHRTFHCWIVSAADGGKLLFQQRQGGSFDGLLDVSAAGHLTAGESVEDGIREVKEELGIKISADEIHHLGERVEVTDLPNGAKNREHQSVFLVQQELPLAEYRPQFEEVSALYWLPISGGMQLFSKKISELTLSGYSYDGEDWEPSEISVTTASFLPRIQQYYLTLLIMAERFLAGLTPLAIS